MSFHVVIDRSDTHVKVSMWGAIDEFSHEGFKPMLSIGNGKTSVNLDGVTSINSMGVRVWLNFMKNFRLNHEIILQKCPVDVVMQINMIPDFLGMGQVESFYAPYFCEKCNRSYQMLFLTEDIQKDLGLSLSTQNCPTCKAPNPCGEDTDEYLYFMKL